jgi:hypothetical protein
MIFKRINRDSPEQIFITVRNGSATTAFASGGVAMWDVNSGDNDGVKVQHGQNSANRTITFAGIAVEAIATGEYGLIQVWGYNSTVNIRMSGTTAVYTGCPLYANITGARLNTPTVASGFTGADTGYILETWPAAFAMEAYTTTTAADIQIAAFIKAL